jgi:hypothetical protein
LTGNAFGVYRSSTLDLQSSAYLFAPLPLGPSAPLHRFDDRRRDLLKALCVLRSSTDEFGSHRTNCFGAKELEGDCRRRRHHDVFDRVRVLVDLLRPSPGRLRRDNCLSSLGMAGTWTFIAGNRASMGAPPLGDRRCKLLDGLLCGVR